MTNEHAPPGASAGSEQISAAASAAADAFESGGTRGPFPWTLSTGVVVEVSGAPPNVISDAASRIPKPDPPMIMNPDKQREEPNPDHPSYAKALEQWEVDQATAGAEVAALLGIKILSVPEGFPRHEGDGDDWIDDIEYLLPHLKVRRDNERARRIAWLRFYAARSNSDVSIVNSAPMILSGVSEEDVRRMVNSFRRLEVWNPDQRVSAESDGPSRDGDSVQPAERDGSGDRGEGSGDLPEALVGGLEREGSPVPG